MLILKSLARLGPMHGYGIAAHIQQTSEDVLQVEEGSLYPALQRMMLKGWLSAEWGQSKNNRREAGVMTVIARLKPGVMATQASAEMAAIGQRQEKQHPEDRGISVETVRLSDLVVGHGPRFTSYGTR